MRTTILLFLLLSHTYVYSIDIIAHRGASGYLPEHTKEAAVLAFMQGAHYIEQDLVVSKDNQLVVLHDIHIETVTNVEQVFPMRARKDGRFYAVDFTLPELRQLSVHERQDENNKPIFDKRYKGNAHYTVSTFAEHVELIENLNHQFSRNVGLYPEIKAPEWHLTEGKDIAKLLFDALNRLGLNNEKAAIYVQSFEPNSLQRLKNDFSIKVPLIQLIAQNDWQESSADYTAMQTIKGLYKISRYADGIGPWLPQIVQDNTMTPFYKHAKQAGLLVHPYTFRSDVINNVDTERELFDLLKAHEVDGLFTDQVLSYMFDE